MIDILYEDEALLFLNKPPGIVVQRGFDPDEPVLFELAQQHTSPLFLLQRLDRGTSGVLFFTKLASVNVRITRQFERKDIRKRYLAICEGEIREAQTVDAPLTRTGAITFGVRFGGKRSVTRVEPIVSSPNGSLVSIGLMTGRTHQIRVHLSAIGHPLVGDWLYGARNAPRPMLHSAEIAMKHPLTRSPLSVSAPLPADFVAALGERGLVAPSVIEDETPSVERT